MVIDRLQLFIFLAVTIGGTIGILIDAPHIFEFIDQEARIAEINLTNTTNTSSSLVVYVVVARVVVGPIAEIVGTSSHSSSYLRA